jgi:Domain of Unknown Function (DUF1080)
MEKLNHASSLLACIVVCCLIVLIGIMMLIPVTHLLTPAESLEKLKKINRPTTIHNTFYDDFQGNTYRLTDGQTSPNGKWKAVYSGHGSMGTAIDNSTSGSANNYFFEQPNTSMRYNDTSASLVITSKAFSDFQMTLDVKTVRQLRQNSPPASWETAWIFWHYTDRFHYYGLVLKTNGFQIEKKDNNVRCDCEIYLVDVPHPKVKLDKWQTITLRVTNSASGTPHIKVWVDGILAADFTDNSIHQPNSSNTALGMMGMYNEDSLVNFDNVTIIPLP